MSADTFDEAMTKATPSMAATLALARYAGLRACEIAKLDWRDVRLTASDPVMEIRDGKGGRARRAYVCPELVEILLALPHRSGPVIPRADGAPGYNTAARISQRAGEFLRDEVGTMPGQTLHSLRHAFGTAVYEATRDMRIVQESLGHQSITTSQIYTKVYDRDRAKAVRAAAKVRLDEAS